MNEKKELNELLTPAQLADEKIMSLTKQWQERNAGRLKCYRVGRKILYAPQHVADYLALTAAPRHTMRPIKP